MREAIERRMSTLKEELQRADEELSKLRPRVNYLEQMILRLDGALTVCQALLDDTPEPAQLNPVGPYGPEIMQPRKPDGMPWETVAP